MSHSPTPKARSRNARAFVRAEMVFAWVLLIALGCNSNGQAALSSAAEPQTDTNSSKVTEPLRKNAENKAETTDKPIVVTLASLPEASRARHRLTKTGAGLVLTGGKSKQRLLSSILVYQNDKEGFQKLPVTLSQGRYGHSATALPGADAIMGTADDAVLVVGGFDGEQALSSVEVIVPDPNGDGRFNDAQVIAGEDLPYALAEHSASLALKAQDETDASAVLLCGGMLFRESEDGQQEKASVTSAALLVTVIHDRDIQIKTRLISQPRYARRGHSASVLPGADGQLGTLDDLVVIYGGRGLRVDRRAVLVSQNQDESYHSLSAAEVYEAAFDRWTQVTLLGERELIKERVNHRAVVLGQDLLIIGGRHDGGLAERALRLRIEGNNPALADLEDAGLMRQSREHPELAKTKGQVFVLGGFNENLGRALDSIEVYTPKRGRLSKPGRFKRSNLRLSASRVYHAVADYQGHIVVTGGYVEPNTLQQPDVEALPIR